MSALKRYVAFSHSIEVHDNLKQPPHAPAPFGWVRLATVSRDGCQQTSFLQTHSQRFCQQQLSALPHSKPLRQTAHLLRIASRCCFYLLFFTQLVFLWLIFSNMTHTDIKQSWTVKKSSWIWSIKKCLSFFWLKRFDLNSWHNVFSSLTCLSSNNLLQRGNYSWTWLERECDN